MNPCIHLQRLGGVKLKFSAAAGITIRRFQGNIIDGSEMHQKTSSMDETSAMQQKMTMREETAEKLASIMTVAPTTVQEESVMNLSLYVPTYHSAGQGGERVGICHHIFNIDAPLGHAPVIKSRPNPQPYWGQLQKSTIDLPTLLNKASYCISVCCS